MTTLKMTSEDTQLLVNVLVKFTSDYRPMRYGGDFRNYSPITDDEWVRLTNLIQKLPVEIKL
jgi:hypothetical protein